jgi:hypothetical protein
MKGSELLGFLTLSIVRYSKNFRTQRFANGMYFHHQVQKPIIECCTPSSAPFRIHVRKMSSYVGF